MTYRPLAPRAMVAAIAITPALIAGYLAGTINAPTGSVCRRVVATECVTWTPAPTRAPTAIPDPSRPAATPWWWCVWFPTLCATATPTPTIRPTMPIATVAPEAMPTRPRPATQYGLQIVGGPSPAERAAVDGLSPTWIRARVFWTPGMSGWGWSDAVVEYAETHRARLLLEWWIWRTAAGPGADCSDVEVDAHAAHAAALAARYRGRVDAYQIDNEPDLRDVCGGPVAYAARYEAVRAAIEAADPATTVVPAGLAMHPMSTAWLVSMLAALDRPPAAVAIHGYPELGEPISKVIAAQAAAGVPVWVTETGATNADPETVRQGMRACSEAAVPVCMVYRAADDDDPRGFGLYDVLGRPKPAAEVYREEAAR